MLAPAIHATYCNVPLHERLPHALPVGPLAQQAQQHLSVTAGGSFLADLSMRSMMQEYLRVSASCRATSGLPRNIAHSRPRAVLLHLTRIASRPVKQTWLLLPQARLLRHRG